MRARNTWIAVVAVVLLAIVIVFGLQSRPGEVAVASPSPTTSARPSASASATPSATATASGSPAAPAAGIYNDAFGFVVTDLSTLPTVNPAVTSKIRTESSGAPVGSFTHNGYCAPLHGPLIPSWPPRTP